jgi:hypothetical protein
MTEIQISKQEAVNCLDGLWRDANQRDGFGVICTALRIEGLQDVGWDPFQESYEAFKDYDWHLRVQSSDLSPRSHWRIGLLIYCQACEMSAVHTTLANLLRIILGERYHVDPLNSLGRPDKRRPLRWFPASAKVKWRKIRRMAQSANRTDLIRIVDAVYNDAIRNAFSHSDYIITENDFRWTEGGLAEPLPLPQLNNLISNALVFFGAFAGIRSRLLEEFGKMPRYHRWPNFQVFELLKTEGMLDGFRIHDSTGSSALFRRGPDGVDLENIIPRNDGLLEFIVGNAANERPNYVVDGQVVDFGEKNAVDVFQVVANRGPL